MAKLVQRVEKDLLLKMLCTEKRPVIYRRDQFASFLFLKKMPKDNMVFLLDMPIDSLRPNEQIELMFNHLGNRFVFDVKVLSLTERELTSSVPDVLRSDLERIHFRVRPPSEMQIRFAFFEDRYDLEYPKVLDFFSAEFEEIQEDLLTLKSKMEECLKDNVNNLKLALFEGKGPSSMEEHLLAERGKILYLPSTRDKLPSSDPYPHGKLVTEDIFRNYLESIGNDEGSIDNICAQFIRERAENGILSEVWVPIRFQEYVIGYIHIWINDEKKACLDYPVIDIVYRYAQALAQSFRAEGRFDKGKISPSFQAEVQDISISGLLLAIPYCELCSKLMKGCELNVGIMTPKHGITVRATVIRRNHRNEKYLYSCNFRDMDTEDCKFLFEYIYDRRFTGNWHP